MKSKEIFGTFLLFLILMSGCSGTIIKHITAEEFLNKAKHIEQMASAKWILYIGSSKTRAYLEYGDVLAIGSRTRTIVYWTELNQLPEDIAAKLRAGNPPWIPWWEKNKKAKDNQSLHSDG